MSEDARRRSLGRGLSALFQAEQPPASESSAERALKTIPIEKLSPPFAEMPVATAAASISSEPTSV